jgi:hypothetical protein
MKNKIIIGVCGFQGSGKDTVADYLVNTHGFRRISFAGTLKDAISQVFGWDREMLEGRTTQSREWREQVDPWWSTRLNIPHLTPRWILQYWGTEVCRKSFHDDIWIASVEHRMLSLQDNVVLSDVRFPNEIRSIKNSGGLIIRTHRGPEPEWYDLGLQHNLYKSEEANRELIKLGVHASETAWIGTRFDAVLDNDGSIDDLYAQIKNLLQSLQSST